MSRPQVKSVFLHLALATVVVALCGGALYSSGLETVRMEDRCDPATFNEEVGEGTCVGDRDTTFQEFLEEFIATGSVDHWRFKEDEFRVRRGESVNSFNIGGEAHTFTPVAQFGGGFVPELNAFAGPIAPECIPTPNPQGQLVAPGPELVFPGAESTPVTLTDTGVQRFQCCIHPWMRTEVTVRRR